MNNNDDWHVDIIRRHVTVYVFYIAAPATTVVQLSIYLPSTDGGSSLVFLNKQRALTKTYPALSRPSFYRPDWLTTGAWPTRRGQLVGMQTCLLHCPSVVWRRFLFAVKSWK